MFLLLLAKKVQLFIQFKSPYTIKSPLLKSLCIIHNLEKLAKKEGVQKLNIKTTLVSICNKISFYVTPKSPEG
uniref:hypothetical protein n=1 Tax=Carboxylicivirga caseinilyticus TaxID=3417572 RepID=UPI003D34D913